jgi:hypothetical protein
MIAAGAVAGTVAGAIIAGAIRTLPQRQPSPPATASAAPTLRTVKAESQSAGCAAGEELVSAYCYSTPGTSLSASGVALRQGENGIVSASCLTGGRQIVLYCLKR